MLLRFCGLVNRNLSAVSSNIPSIIHTLNESVAQVSIFKQGWCLKLNNNLNHFGWDELNMTRSIYTIANSIAGY